MNEHRVEHPLRQREHLANSVSKLVNPVVACALDEGASRFSERRKDARLQAGRLGLVNPDVLNLLELGAQRLPFFGARRRSAGMHAGEHDLDGERFAWDRPHDAIESASRAQTITNGPKDWGLGDATLRG